MTVNAVNKDPNETTKLLGVLPSANSAGSLPLTTSLEDIQGNMELHLKTIGDKSNKHQRKRTMEHRHLASMFLFGFAFSLAMVLSLINNRPVNVPKTTNHLQPAPFSRKHPVRDMGLYSYHRPDATSPPRGLFRRFHDAPQEEATALPTSAWYQNLLLVKAEPSPLHRAYAIPYVIDLIGVIPGLRIHGNFLVASRDVVQLSVNENFGLTLGSAGDINSSKENYSHQYTVGKTTELGLTLHWDTMKMFSTIVKGMPYATMIYEDRIVMLRDGDVVHPTVAASIPFGRPPLADGSTEIICGSTGTNKTLVQKEVELYFRDSDYSWLIFFSEPVWVQCVVSQENSNNVFLQVVDYLMTPQGSSDDNNFIIRASLHDSCTSQKNPTSCEYDTSQSKKEDYKNVLRRHANFYPGQHTSFKYEINEGESEAKIVFDWDTQLMRKDYTEDVQTGLRRELNSDMEGQRTSASHIMFALPHHLDKLDKSVYPNNEQYCKTSLSGAACLVEGIELSIMETLPTISLRAPRPPKPDFIPLIAAALEEDIDYSLPDYFQRGAGDTYFSGKFLSKLARILVVAEEILEICQTHPGKEYKSFCQNSSLPLADKMSAAVDRLQSGVEIWINGTAETPFVYDPAWGGVVSCGCYFNGGGCDNKFPNCPAFSDQGLDFGNGFYNDQHFHYGYHIYAAAVVAHFKPEWGAAFFEHVLLLVRSIANPSKDDTSFPLFRHKDWYQGHSWASGVPLPPYLNGKNQESSSEAIAAYEAVALYGKVMSDIWKSEGDTGKTATSKRIEKVGQLMAATELRSAQRYWHVIQSDKSQQIYPEVYDRNVVGILWNTMAQFGTWFGNAEYLPFGIQLLPLTPISEERDELAWMNEMYDPFSQSCSSHFACTEYGWVVLQLAVLATVGYADEAAKQAVALPNESFINAGGNGHSRSNTLWYIGTRPLVENPIPVAKADIRGSDEAIPAPIFVLKDCHTPETCTDDVLDRKAGLHSCRDRISWLINVQGKSQWEACSSVSGFEFPKVCGPCDPSQHPQSDEKSENDDKPGNTTTSAEASPTENESCPPCPKTICYGKLNQCPLHTAPYICIEGDSIGGCSSSPWALSNGGPCSTCCEILQSC